MHSLYIKPNFESFSAYGAETLKIGFIQQVSIKRTTINFLKVLQSNTFKKFIGLGLSAKRCN